ncbi:hypothetical protein B0H11DRAFT_1914610 [Mycena galericulata]|nr:hypothetical protein B0H11DRAFT_1914610 [Mycena galericulata]
MWLQVDAQDPEEFLKSKVLSYKVNRLRHLHLHLPSALGPKCEDGYQYRPSHNQQRREDEEVREGDGKHRSGAPGEEYLGPKIGFPRGGASAVAVVIGREGVGVELGEGEVEDEVSGGWGVSWGRKTGEVEMAGRRAEDGKRMRRSVGWGCGKEQGDEGGMGGRQEQVQARRSNMRNREWWHGMENQQKGWDTCWEREREIRGWRGREEANREVWKEEYERISEQKSIEERKGGWVTQRERGGGGGAERGEGTAGNEGDVCGIEVGTGAGPKDWGGRGKNGGQCSANEKDSEGAKGGWEAVRTSSHAENVRKERQLASIQAQKEGEEVRKEKNGEEKTMGKRADEVGVQKRHKGELLPPVNSHCCLTAARLAPWPHLHRKRAMRTRHDSPCHSRAPSSKETLYGIMTPMMQFHNLHVAHRECRVQREKEGETHQLEAVDMPTPCDQMGSGKSSPMTTHAAVPQVIAHADVEADEGEFSLDRSGVSTGGGGPFAAVPVTAMMYWHTSHR